MRSISVSMAVLCACLAFATQAEPAAFPLGVSPSGRHLVDQTGAPFFVNGDASWSITHSLTYAEAVQYMENRRAKGMNALLISVLSAFGQQGPAASYPPDRQGQYPFVDNDITRPNEPYWQNVDNVLAKAEEMGFLVLYWPIYLGCCNDGFMGLLQQNGVTKAREYGRFVGRRHGGRKNLIWVHGGDHDPDPVRDLVSAVKAGIEEVGPARLHATHWAPETEPYGPYGDAFTDLYATYTYGPVASLVSRDYAHTPTKPVILLETHYENESAGKTAEDVRKYPYRAVLSGAAGHFFGNKPLWFNGYGWETALDGPGSRSMEWVGRLFNSRPWHLLVPAPGALVTSGGGDRLSDNGVQAARASNGSFAMAFLPDRRTIQVALGQISGTSVRAWWVSVATGTAASIGTFPASGTQAFTSPDAGGYVLVLDDASQAFAPPGSGQAPSGPLKRRDIIWQQPTSGGLYAWLLSGTAAAGYYLTPPALADTRWQARGLADFNGDGSADILWHHQGTGDLYVWFMNGTVATGGSYLTPSRFADTRWQIRAVGDLSGDGKLDLLWHHQVTGDLYAWFLNGATTIGGSYLTPSRFTDTRWQIRGLEDLNGDGKADLLWHHQVTGDLYAWILSGTVVTTGSYLSPARFADTRWKIVRLADYNADGKPDVLWNNRSTGELYVWLMNGLVVTSGAYLTPSVFSDTSWLPVP